jgi:hypothetical protein
MAGSTACAGAILRGSAFGALYRKGFRIDGRNVPAALRSRRRVVRAFKSSAVGSFDAAGRRTAVVCCAVVGTA